MLGQEIVRLYVNKEYKGLFRQFRQVNESYVRDLGFMPGDVFVGENIGRDELSRVYGNLFANAWYWSKAATNNHFPADHRPHLEDLLDALASYSYDDLYRILDYQNAVDTWAVCNLTGNIRLLNVRNWRIYFDQLRGRFKILLYDTEFGESAESWDGELVPSQPFYVMLRDPEMLAAVNLRMLGWLEEGILSQAAADLEATASEAEGSELGEEEFVSELRGYADLLRRREAFLLEGLKPAELLWQQDADALTLYYKGMLPLEGVELDGDGAALAGKRIYPGRSHLPALKKPVEHMAAKPVFAEHRIVGAGEVSTVRARIEGLGTAVEARRITAEEAASLPLDTISIDPAEHAPTPTREHRYAGDVRLSEDLVVGERDQLIVAPGTRFFLEKGVSIVLRSRTELQDVGFTGDAAEPWGVVAFQGPAAAGSTVVGCRFEHGSKDVIDHIEYSGMLSIHDVPQIRIEGNHFGKNLIADDTLRAAVSSVELLGNEFVDARSDAVDFDLSTGTIAGNTFIGSGNDSIDLMTTRVEIHGNHILRSGDKGISIGERSGPVVHDNVIVGCKTGMEVKDGSLALAYHNVLVDNSVGVRLYWKNWRYSRGGRAWFFETLLRGNEAEVDAQSRSRLVLQGSFAEGLFVDGEDRTQVLEPAEGSFPAAAVRAALEGWTASAEADLREKLEGLDLPWSEKTLSVSDLEQKIPGETTTFGDYLDVDPSVVDPGTSP